MRFAPKAFCVYISILMFRFRIIDISELWAELVCRRKFQLISWLSRNCSSPQLLWWAGNMFPLYLTLPRLLIQLYHGVIWLYDYLFSKLMLFPWDLISGHHLLCLVCGGWLSNPRIPTDWYVCYSWVSVTERDFNINSTKCLLHAELFFKFLNSSLVFQQFIGVDSPPHG